MSYAGRFKSPAPAANHSAPRDGQASSGSPVPLWRDPWAWLTALAVAPTCWAARGTPWGSPVVDDFHFLEFSWLRGNPSWLDGGGGAFYWRPLARQLYFGLLGGWMLEHPERVAALHVLALMIGGLALYAALRRVWPAPAAAVAATTPLVLDGARMLIVWPSGAQDLGAFMFLALALAAAARGALMPTLAASLAALLCKETAAAVVPLLAWLPTTPARAWRTRARWTLALGGLLAAWWGAHAWVSHHAALAAVASVAPPEAAATPLLDRLAWAAPRAARDAFNLDLLDRPIRLAIGFACAAVLAVGLAISRSRPANPESTRGPGGLLWGAAWAALATGPVTLLYPDWTNYRMLLPALGFGVAFGALLGRAPVWIVWAFVGLRCGALLAAPGAPAAIGIERPESGRNVGFPTLARMQQFTAEVRRATLAARPQLPHGAVLVSYAWPRQIEQALERGLAFRVWYRDSTLRLAGFGEFRDDRALPASALVAYQPGATHPVTILAPAAMREFLDAIAALRAGEFEAGLDRLAAAARLESDSHNTLFLAQIESKRASALQGLGRPVEAEQAALRAYALNAEDLDARVLLADAAIRRGELGLARSLLESHLASYPHDSQATSLHARLRIETATPSTPP